MTFDQLTDTGPIVGTKWRHNKRGSDYVVIANISDEMNLVDNQMIEIPEYEGEIMVQRSTEARPDKWVLYQNEQKMLFLRPFSEFTPDRFTRIFE